MNIQTALATVRQGKPDNAGPVWRHDYETACEFAARWFAEHADQLWTIPTLEWEDLPGMSQAKTIFGYSYVWFVACDKWLWQLGGASCVCDSLSDGKAKANEHYRSRLTAALRPAIGEVGKGEPIQ